LITTGQDGNDAISAECRRALGRVLKPEPSRCTRSHVDQAPVSGREPVDDRIDSRGEVRQNLLNGLDRVQLVTDDEFDLICRRAQIEIKQVAPMPLGRKAR
jgi:hypothetical protein